jgi:hypothetical protein
MNEESDYDLLQQVKERSRPVSEDFWATYLDRVKNRRLKSKTFVQEQVEPYLPYIVWDNATFDKDMALFWMAVSKHHRTNLSGSTVRLMEWVKKKNSLHPKQVIKMLLSRVINK